LSNRFDRRSAFRRESADTIRLRGAGLGLRVAAAAATLTPFSGTWLYRDPPAGFAGN
jgi:hypothetical protein